jgi:hypothetical protein
MREDCQATRRARVRIRSVSRIESVPQAADIQEIPGLGRVGLDLPAE